MQFKRKAISKLHRQSQGAMRLGALCLVLGTTQLSGAERFDWRQGLNDAWFFSGGNYVRVNDVNWQTQNLYNFYGPGQTVDVSGPPLFGIPNIDRMQVWGFLNPNGDPYPDANWVFDFLNSTHSSRPQPGTLTIGDYSQAALFTNVTTTFRLATVMTDNTELNANAGFTNTLTLALNPGITPNWTTNTLSFRGAGTNNLGLFDGASLTAGTITSSGLVAPTVNLTLQSSQLSADATPNLSNVSLLDHSDAEFTGNFSIGGGTYAGDPYNQFRRLDLESSSLLHSASADVTHTDVYVYSTSAWNIDTQATISDSYVQVYGPGAVINGNLTISNGSRLGVTSDATVNGNISLADNSTLESYYGNINGNVDVLAGSTPPAWPQPLIHLNSATISGNVTLDLGSSTPSSAVLSMESLAHINGDLTWDGIVQEVNSSGISGKVNIGGELLVDDSFIAGTINLTDNGASTSGAWLILDHDSRAYAPINVTATNQPVTIELLNNSISYGSVEMDQPGTLNLYVGSNSFLGGMDPSDKLYSFGNVRVDSGGAINLSVYNNQGSITISGGGSINSGSGVVAVASGTVNVNNGGAINGVLNLTNSSLETQNGATLTGRLNVGTGPISDYSDATLRGISSVYTFSSVVGGGQQTYDWHTDTAGGGGTIAVRDGATVNVDQDPNGFNVLKLYQSSELIVASDSTVNIGTAAGGAPGDVAVGPGGYLTGTGTILATQVVNNGGEIDPGNSPGTLHVQGDYLQTGGVLNLEIGGIASSGYYDQLDVTGNITITGGTIRFTPYNGFIPFSTETYSFFTGFSHLIIGPGVTFEPTGGLQFNGYDPNTGTFEIGKAAAVPEPSSLWAAGIGATALFLRRRRLFVQ